MDEEWGRGFELGYKEGERETKEALQDDKNKNKQNLEIPESKIRIEGTANTIKFGLY